MALRIDSCDVEKLIPDTGISDLSPFMTVANLTVNRLAASDCGEELLDEELFEIERWLSAHFAAVSDPSLALVSEDFEGAKNVYSRGSSKNMGGLLSTQYGQMANTLSGGCLSKADMKQVSFGALGGEHYSE